MDAATANVWIAGLLSAGGVGVAAICKMLPRRNGNGHGKYRCGEIQSVQISLAEHLAAGEEWRKGLATTLADIKTELARLNTRTFD